MTAHPAAPAPPSLPLPRSWVRRRRPGEGLVVAARAPELPPGGYRPEVALHVGEVGPGGLDAWRATAMAELSALLHHVEVEDDDRYELAGLPVAYRRFSHRLGTVDVICDQWAWLLDESYGRPDGPATGVVLTCSVARCDYPDYCDLFEDLAAGVELVPAAA